MPPFAAVDTVQVLQAGMKTAAMNHRLIAQNIANADTPGYNPKTLDFQGTLSAVLEGRSRTPLRRTDPRHFEGTQGVPELRSLAVMSKNDYNKVDLEQEMANLSENTGRYNLFSSLLIKQFQVTKDMLTKAR